MVGLRRRAAAVAAGMALAAVAGGGLAVGGARAHRAAAPCLPTPAGMRALPCPLYGVTADDVSQLGALSASLRHLARMPTTRIVFDTGSSVASYGAAIRTLTPVSYLMGEVLDSSEEKGISDRAEHARVASLLRADGAKVDVWEIGNEVNGSWLGPYADVERKLADAYDQVTAAGKRTALTLYANDLAPDHCGDGAAELTPAQFTVRYVPARVRAGVDLVLLSYYEQNCGGARPTVSQWTSEFAALHGLYPHAALGFGEIGLLAPATASTLAYARGMISHYYGLQPTVNRWVGGEFWWYYAEDAVPYTAKPIWGALNAAFTAGPGARARSSGRRTRTR